MQATIKEKRRVRTIKIDADTHMALSVYCSWTRKSMIDVATEAIKGALPKLPKPPI